MVQPATQNDRLSKRQLAALVASRVGLLRVIRTARLNTGLFVLAYHRIGDAKLCPVDDQLVTTTASELAAHVRVVQRWARVASLSEVLVSLQAGHRDRTAGVLFTFDDAYRDNYELAFPVLRSLGASGTFFVPTGLIETRHLSWWDRLAYSVKHSRVSTCALEYPEGFSLERVCEDPAGASRSLLRHFKAHPELDKERFVAAVERATGARAADDPTIGEQFASWSQLREMAENGMDLASHTHTHRLLDHLTLEEQREELARSRGLLFEKTGVRTDVIAYPVGSRHHFNQNTRIVMKELGYRAGFSHYGGWNPSLDDPYDIRRLRIDDTVRPEFLRAAICWPQMFAI